MLKYVEQRRTRRSCAAAASVDDAGSLSHKSMLMSGSAATAASVAFVSSERLAIWPVLLSRVKLLCDAAIS